MYHVHTVPWKRWHVGTRAPACRRFPIASRRNWGIPVVKQENSSGADGEIKKPRNLVFSPLSVYTALSLAAAGAQGTTLSELLDVLGARSRGQLADNVRFMTERALPDEQQPAGGPRIVHACGLWHDARDKLKPAYRDAAAASCKGVARAVDFIRKPEEARTKINNWVAAATNNLIDSILGPRSVCRDTRLVLTSAIYFKGAWETPFNKARTKEDKFHRLDGSTVDPHFMRSGEDQFIAAYNGFKVLKMPYKVPNHPPPTEGFWAAAARAVLPWRTRTTTVPTPPRYSMCVFLPDARDGLFSLEEKMASSPSGFLRKHMPNKQVKVGDFRVPRFKLSFGASLKRVLQDLGVKAMFDPARSDMPDILESSSEEPQFVGDVLHKAVIEVNEEGTEAAAATVVVRLLTQSRQWRPEPVRVDFVADRPFAFFVVEEGSGAVLFAGHVVDPTDS